MNYLVVIAHPDDDVLGAGASVKKFTQNGDSVSVCIMCAKALARSFRLEDSEFNADIEKSAAILGINRIYKGNFPNIEMNSIPHLQLVQFIEQAIIESAPDIIITHHPADTNNDHLHTSLTCQAAIRIFQRNEHVKPINEVWYMECLSSTEWSVNTSVRQFTPNTFVEVGKDNLAFKIKALEAYRGVMRPYPHPRSREVIEGLAAYRGAQSGCNYAEAFECVFRRSI